MISKTLRKTLAVSLATVMAVGAMAGCGSKEEQGADPTQAPEPTQAVSDDKPEATATPEPTPTPELRKDENGNVYDLGGMEVIIRDWWSGDGTRKEATNAYEEARYEYIDWIQDTYNFTIKEMAIGGWGDNPTDFVNYAQTGGDENYVFVLRQDPAIVSAMNQGLMFDLATLDCLDFTEEKWRSDVHVLMGQGDSIYGMRGIAPEARGCIYFNKRLLTEAGIDPEDLYKWQQSGEWTWEKFEEICKKVQQDNNADGITDVWAMVQQSAEFYKQAVFANGGSFIGKDANGKYYNNLESAETIDALNWAVEMKQTYEMPKPEGGEWNYYYAEFKNGNAVFFTGQAYDAGQNLKDMEDDYGCVLFPKGPKANDYISFYEDNVMVIPNCYDEDKAFKIALAYDLYTDPVPGFEDDDEAWKGEYYAAMRDTESVDLTVAKLRADAELMHHLMISGINLGSDLTYNLGTAINAEGKLYTPAEKAESLRQAWNDAIDKANK